MALGAALLARGHHVTLSTGQGFDGLIADHHLVPAPLSVDMQALVDSSTVQAALTSPAGWLRAFRATKALMQRQLDDMWTVARQVSPQVIVYNPQGFVAPYLARALGAIALPSFLQPAFVATAAFAPPLTPFSNLGPVGNKLCGRTMIALMRLGYRSLLGKWLPRHPEVPARPGLDALAGYHPDGRRVPRLHAHSRHLVPTPADWGAAERVTGYWFLNGRSSWQPPAALVDFLAAGPPPIYVGFGSMPAVDADRTASVVLAALRRARVRAVLAKGWGALAKATADNAVHVVDSAPHDWLFPRCGAVVHHGGAGTTHEGLRWGRPTLVCPVFGDQPFWGRVVARIGAGPVPIPLRRLTEDRLSTALASLLADVPPSRVSALSRDIQSESGAEAGADLIDAVLSR